MMICSTIQGVKEVGVVKTGAGGSVQKIFCAAHGSDTHESILRAYGGTGD